jgi:general secretion pathway protein K
MTGKRGFALIAALGLLVAFGAVGLALGLELRVARLGAANAAEHARALEAAHAGVAQVQSRLAQLLRDGRSGRLFDARLSRDQWAAADSSGDTVRVGDARALVQAADLGTRLNLNVAAEDELRRLFVALRIDAGEADRLAQRIADWRDGDELRRGRGAEGPDYMKAGLPPPRNAPFEQLAELRGVLGMTDQRYARIRPYLTVHGTGRVNLNAADRVVLLAMPGMSEAAVKVVRDRRGAGRPLGSVSELLQLLPSGARETLLPEAPRLEGRVVFESREMEVVSEGTMAGSPVRARVRVILARAGEHAVPVWRQTE